MIPFRIRRFARRLPPAALLALALQGCGAAGSLDVFEKNVPIPQYEWHSAFRPAVDVRIEDTTARYDLYVTLRHNNAYPFSNIWVIVGTAYEGERPSSRRVELPLADPQGRWLGSRMDDIIEHRIPIQRRARFDRAGVYHFSFGQNMRLDPLPHIMSVGLRIEKIPGS